MVAPQQVEIDAAGARVQGGPGCEHRSARHARARDGDVLAADHDHIALTAFVRGMGTRRHFSETVPEQGGSRL